MKQTATSYVALLRGINVSGINKIPMRELASLCADLGWGSVRTCLQTGNVVFTSAASAVALEAALEQAIEARFGFSIPVIVRSAGDFEACLDGAALRDLAAADPSRLLLYLTKAPIPAWAIESLDSRAKAGERIFVQEASLWIYFSNGVGSSKLTPSVIDRAVQSSATGRNWNTVSKIRALLSE